MPRLSALDVLIILALVGLLVFIGSKEFPLYSGRSVPVPSPTTVEQTS